MPRLFSAGADRRRSAIPLLAVLLGAAVRLAFILPADFPLNDGGLFYAMVRDLQANDFRLPLQATYNFADIPFAYPPLAFYLAGLLDHFLNWDLLSLLRWIPLAANVLTIPAFHALARALAPEGRTAGIAMIVFALLPRSFQWLIMGGGLTRSLGFLFALLALRRIYLLLARRDSRHLPLAILFSGLVMLCHLEMAWFVAYTAVLLAVFFARKPRDIRNAAVLAGGAALVAAPWWVTVIRNHGMAPFQAASEHGWPLLSGALGLLLQGPTAEAFLPAAGLLSLLGILACMVETRLLLPIWLCSMFLLDPRSAYTTATAPLALLAAIGIDRALLPLLRRARPARSEDAIRRAGSLITAGLTLYLALAATIGQTQLLAPLKPAEREAMAWVAANTPAGAVFVTIPAELWPADRSSEWFPVLAGRASISTVQGAEWEEQGSLASRIERHRVLQRCAADGTACLDRWLEDAGAEADYVYAPKRASAQAAPWLTRPADCCSALITSLAHDRRYALVYDGPGAAIYRRD